MGWIERNLARVVVGLLILLAIAAALTARSCAQARTAKAETKLATGQAAAATASGSDAANTVGNRMAADAAIDTTTRSNADAIDHAEGAAAPVPPAVGAAVRAGLCRRAAYRGDPRCLQHADP